MNNYPRARRMGSFPSEFEASVYLKLCQICGSENVSRYGKVQLTSTIPWECDFTLTTEPRLYIEAKGIDTEAFRLKLLLLMEFRADITPNTLLVFPNEKLYKKYLKIYKRCCLLSNLETSLKSYKQVKLLLQGDSRV